MHGLLVHFLVDEVGDDQIEGFILQRKLDAQVKPVMTLHQLIDQLNQVVRQISAQLIQVLLELHVERFVQVFRLGHLLAVDLELVMESLAFVPYHLQNIELLLLGLNEIQLDLNNPCNQNVSLLLVLLIKLIVVVQPQLQILFKPFLDFEALVWIDHKLSHDLLKG